MENNIYRQNLSANLIYSSIAMRWRYLVTCVQCKVKKNKYEEILNWEILSVSYGYIFMYKSILNNIFNIISQTKNVRLVLLISFLRINILQFFCIKNVFLFYNVQYIVFQSFLIIFCCALSSFFTELLRVINWLNEWRAEANWAEVNETVKENNVNL